MRRQANVVSRPRWTRIVGFVAVLLLFAVTLAGAATTLRIYASEGQTDIAIDGIAVRIDTTADVIVYLEVQSGDVVGSVEPAPGTRTAKVTITVVDDPDRVIFKGKIIAPSWFSDYIPQESGRGEQ